MRFLFLAFLAVVEASQIIVGEQCPVGYRRDAIGICRQVFDDEDLPSHSIRKEQCECVPYYMCRLEDVFNIGSDCDESEVCCKKGAPTEEDCGWGTISSSANDTQLGEFPWVVAILNVTTNGTWTRDEYIGGGSIVQPRYVLTVAHKVKGKDENTIKCRAGQLMRLAPEPNVAQDRLVARIIIHGSYDRQYLANDIALIELKEPFDVSLPIVRPVCVGKGLEGPPSGSKCFATGWGRRQYDSSEDVDKLKKMQLPLVPRDVCWRALQAVDDDRRRQRGQKLIRRQRLHSSLLCAGGLSGQDTCVGDGGSPLVCQIHANSTHARWAVFGLAAWGVGCGAAGAPGVYVDVTRYRYWVQNFGSVIPPAIIASLVGK